MCSSDLIETATSLAEGLVGIHVIDGSDLLFSQNFACPDHGVSLAELQPRIFSFNAPHGACPRCTGLGSQQEIDPDLVVPDPSLSVDDGALVPWSLGLRSGRCATLHPIRRSGGEVLSPRSPSESARRQTDPARP